MADESMSTRVECSAGASLVDALGPLCVAGERSRLRAWGWLSAATLQVGRSAPVELRGELELVSSDLWLGPEGELHGTVVLAALAAGALPVLTGGRLLMATCGEVEAERVAVEAAAVSAKAYGSSAAEAAPSAPEKAPMDATSRGSRAAATEARPAAPAAPAVSGWAAVAAASATVQAAAEEDEEIDADELERGDVLLHPVLGRCRVLGLLGGDAVKVQIGGRSDSRKLVLRVFRILRQGDTREFRLEKREDR